MTTATLTLSDFLLARYAELERVARTAGDAKAYIDEIGRRSIVLGDGTVIDVDESLVRDAHPGGILAALEHAAWHRPDAVLADIKAKRQIVADQQFTRARSDAPPHSRGMDPDGNPFIEVREWVTPTPLYNDDARAFIEQWYEPSPPTRVLRLLASVYADHPDYRPEWAL